MASGSNEKEMKISSKQIFRLAAIIYADDSAEIDTKEVVKSIVEACMYENKYTDMNIEDIIAYCMNQYSINFTYEEIRTILEKYHNYFTSHQYNKCNYYQLTRRRIEEYEKNQERSIEYYINLFIQEYSPEEREKIQDSIYKFLYELTTTNINSYKIMLSKGIQSTVFTDSELSVDQGLFTEEDKKYISTFLDWENTDKNLAITDIILCCLEYCLIISGDTKNDLTDSFIRNKTVFLDTNIIFRALGINGKNRKEVIVSLLEKCKQGNVKICIASLTEREFFNTIDYHITKLSSYARGKISTESYNIITDYSIYSFYNEWRQTHENLSFKYFSLYIKSLYRELLKEFEILCDTKIPYNSFDYNEKAIIEKYNSSIHHIKDEMRDENYYYNPDEYYTSGNTHDASLIIWIERRREQLVAQGNVVDCFLISSDKSLRYWDLKRKKDQSTIVIYPSHFFALLIKACGRARDDLKSFVSFINLRPKGTTIQPEKADAILSGISVVTEDISTQNTLIQEIMEDGFNTIIKDTTNEIEIYERTKLYSMNYLRNELLKQGQDIEQTKKEMAAVEEKIKAFEEQESITIQEGSTLKTKNERLEQNILEIARKSSKLKYIMKWWFPPFIPIVYTILLICFITLQFFFYNADWNFVHRVNQFILTETIIGKAGGFTLFTLDGGLCVVATYLYKILFRNPFDKTKRLKFRNEITQKYIEDNKLLD